VKCPVVLTFDVDAELLWKVWLSHEPALIDVSQGAYGPRIGLPRILSTLKRLNVKATFFVPGWVVEKYPEHMAQVVREGHELAHHGYLHEDCSKLSEAEERRMVRRGIEAIRGIAGREPRGFRLMPSRSTFKILYDEGFLYDSVLMDDDNPYRIRINDEPTDLIELPVCFSFNDTAYFAYTFGMSKPLLTPRLVEQVYRDEFDALYKERKYCMFMLHPQIIGRPSRLLMLERTIRYMKKRRGVWFAKAEQVAEHCRRTLPRS